MSTCDRREKVWRSCGERYAAIIQQDWFGGGSVTFWGGTPMEESTDFYKQFNKVRKVHNGHQGCGTASTTASQQEG